MRESTSVSQASGSTSFNFIDVMSEYMTAARSPPRSEPTKSQAFLPRAMARSARAAALLVRQICAPPHPLGSPQRGSVLGRLR